MLYTGYFAKTDKYKEAGMHPVSVAGWTPAFFTDTKWTFFAPKKMLFDAWKKGEINNEEYSDYYLKNLDMTIPKALLDKIRILSGKYDIVMCCYEKPGDFCHRRILAKWLEEKLNIKVDEYIIK